MYQTTNTICDATIAIWEDYSDLVFVNKSDAGIRVCYKAVYSSTNKTIYKLSPAIQGIAPVEDKSTSTTNTNLFTEYLTWTKSMYPKTDDSTSFLFELLAVNAGSSQGTINGMSMIDINGDGLVDFLYSRNDPVRRAIIVNQGNFTFKTVYKCAIDMAQLNYYSPMYPVYYGDCADGTRQKEV